MTTIMYATVGCPGQGGRRAAAATETWQHGTVVAAEAGSASRKGAAARPGGGTKHPVAAKCTTPTACFGIVGNPLNTARAHAAVAVQGIVTDVDIKQSAIDSSDNWAIKVIDHIPGETSRGSVFFAHPISFQ